MNFLQSFIAECQNQARDINQEEVEINGESWFGTFGDPQVISDMVRHGYENEIVIPFVAAAGQQATEPVALQVLKRKQNNVEYLIRSIDPKDPVTLTFLLVDRKPGT